MEIRKDTILQVALEQSAIDSSCSPEDFLKSTPVVTLSRPHPKARKYLSLPFDCNLTSYGSNVVASVSEPMREAVTSYLEAYPPEHCFETPHLQVLNDAAAEHDLRVCFMAEYFLPDPAALRPLDCPFDLRVLHAPNFANLYLPAWSNALCEKRKELDVLGIGAYRNGELIGLAACSADCDTMWQIGVDVLPEYRRQGVASCLTSRLALEILEAGKIPFYCAAWSNVKSVRNAIKSGFRPAWVEVGLKSTAFVAEMNRRDPQ
ncbi:MAG: GNAT family N-acetyltransferase [Clostridia bacterium]|nr:GNAT family N-acetyltransferase [Clostridia bacterium]